MKTSSQGYLPLPARVLWPLLSDPEQWPRWMEGIISVQVSSRDAQGGAEEWVERFQSPETGRVVGVRHRVLRRVEGREFVWELIPNGPHSVLLKQALALEPDAHGTTIVYTLEIRKPVLPWGYPSLESREVRTRLRAFLTSSLGRLYALAEEPRGGGERR